MGWSVVELGVDAVVGLAVGVLLGGQRLVAAVVGGQLLLDDVGLDGDAQVVGLAGEVGRGVVVLVLLEGRVAGVAPEDGGQAQLVRGVEGLADLDDLPRGLGRAEVDGGAHRHRAHVGRLLDGAEHDLVELVRVGEELVVVHLHDERDLVGVLARHRAQHAEGGGDGVAAALDGQLDDVLRIEVVGVGRERGAGRVLDALVDRQDRQVAGAARGGPCRRAAAGCAAPGWGDRSTEKTRSTKSGPGRWSRSAETLAL